MKNLFIGIDPGHRGAIVMIDQDKNIVFKSIAPMIGKEYDKMGVLDIFFRYESQTVHAVLEDVHACQMGGNTSSFEFGRGKMLWEMALVAVSISHTLIQPKKWQSVWEGVPKQYLPTSRKNKKGEVVQKIDTKATSLIAAKRLFPNIDLRATERSREPHDGIVDALLMAEYCRRTFK